MKEIASMPMLEATTEQLYAKLDHLESLLGLIREYNDDFMAVIVWSLSVVFGLTLVINGFNWFQSSKALKGEIETLRRQVKSDVEIARTELSNSLKSQIEQIVNSSLLQVSAQLDNIDWRVQILEYHELKVEADSWIDRGVASNAVFYSAKMLEQSLLTGRQHFFEQSIGHLDTSLTMLEKATQKLDPSRLSRVEVIIKTLGENHTTVKESFLEKLKRSQAAG